MEGRKVVRYLSYLLTELLLLLMNKCNKQVLRRFVTFSRSVAIFGNFARAVE